MDRNFLKQSIRRELDYYKDGLFNEDEDEYWERAWAAPDDDDSMAENGFLNVAMAHLQGDECDEIVLLGTEYGYHEPDYDSYIDIGHAFVNDMGITTFQEIFYDHDHRKNFDGNDFHRPLCRPWRLPARPGISGGNMRIFQ